jgi:DNA-binding FadR family transcriptional regulator
MQIKHLPDQLSVFLRYLSAESQKDERIPPLTVLSKELGVSVASLREQLEVARALGWVEVKPRTGIRRLPFSFRPAVEQGLAYAIAVDSSYFKMFSDFRKHVEAAYWFEAVNLLNVNDFESLRVLMTRAYDKLQRSPIQIPHQEHRELHLLIFCRLNNPFVMGILEAYWNLYEAVGLDVYTELHYLQQVWAYHQKMVDAICEGDFSAGFQALSDHMELINQRERISPTQLFE